MNLLILCPINIESTVVSDGIVGDLFVKDLAGIIFRSGWWVNAKNIPDCKTHANITKEQALEGLPLDKSVAISGIEDVELFLSQTGFVRCTKDGNEVAI
jgi:hypothetical protein